MRLSDLAIWTIFTVRLFYGPWEKVSSKAHNLIQSSGGLHLIHRVNLGCCPVFPLGEWIFTRLRPDQDLAVIVLLPFSMAHLV